MSRFIEKLTKLHKTEQKPMGFALGKTSADKRRLPLGVILNPKNMEKILESLTEIDGVLVRISTPDEVKSLEQICRGDQYPPAGGLLAASDKQTMHHLLESACDFVSLPVDSQMNLSETDKIGRVLIVDSTLSEVLLRTVNDLPIDAVLFSEKWESEGLRVSDLMAVRRLALLITKPILLVIPATLTQAELQTLWNLGIGGVVIDLPDTTSLKKFGELRKAAENLAPPTLHKKDKMTAILPSICLESASSVKEDDGEEEDE
jgi:hypothetical protein